MFLHCFGDNLVRSRCKEAMLTFLLRVGMAGSKVIVSIEGLPIIEHWILRIWVSISEIMLGQKVGAKRLLGLTSKILGGPKGFKIEF